MSGAILVIVYGICRERIADLTGKTRRPAAYRGT